MKQRPEGNLNYDIETQKLPFCYRTDYLFYSCKEFKFISNIPKIYVNLIPYKVENVRIKYLKKIVLMDFTGIDLKINGEFVPGVESCASL